MKPTNPLIVLAIMIAIVAALLLPVYLQPPAKDSKKHKGGVIPAPSAIEVPLVPFLDGAGATVDLAAFKGRVVLLNIWAKWCTPCVDKLPDLDRLQRKLAARNGAVVALNVDTGGGPVLVRDFYRELGVENLEIFADPTAQGLFTYANKPWPKLTPVPDWYKSIGSGETKIIKIPPPTKAPTPTLPKNQEPTRVPGSTIVFEAPSIPVTLIIDAGGNIRARIVGDLDWEKETTVDLIFEIAEAPA